MLTKDEAVKILHKARLDDGVNVYLCAEIGKVIDYIKQSRAEQGRKVVHTTALSMHNERNLLVLRTCNDGSVFSDIFPFDIMGQVSELPPIPQGEEK